MRKSRSTVFFTVVVGAVMLLGALIMAAILFAAGAPQAVAVGVVLAALPFGPVIGCYLWLDRYEPEPKSLLLLGLGWGAFVATTLALFLQAFDSFAFGSSEAVQSVLVAPVTEEAAKGLFILLLLFFRRAELDGILDGIVYAGMVGVGFAFMEDILYLSQAYIGTDGRTGGIESAVGLFVVRGIASPFAHPLFTAFTGIGIGIAVGSPKRWVRVLAPALGYLGAVCAHGAWNGSLLVDGGRDAAPAYLLVMVPIFAAMVGFAIWARRREGVLLATSLTDCAARGFLEAREVPWLARIPARKACRTYAEKIGGKPALEAMTHYQTEAIELGFLHHRFLRGTPPDRYEELGRDHVATMFALRGKLLWPQPAVAQPSGVLR
ncbi:MAG TPA: PrsW family intramembrane metalloprotease [Marmoricola sp.]|jgi:RsiW-degrading membrane proteinase PrsW (M82 family)|nr:PrsW family intramembrane metalloprotease [Marmoricola sp.]